MLEITGMNKCGIHIWNMSGRKINGSSKERGSMRKITARIVRFFIESKVIDETDQEIYEYGLEILIENIMLTVFLLLFGVMIGKGIETCIL